MAGTGSEPDLCSSEEEEKDISERTALLKANTENKQMDETEISACQGRDNYGISDVDCEVKDPPADIANNTGAEYFEGINSKSWYLPTILLCCYGFLKDMKPSEPFLTPYLNSSYKHISERDLSNQVYPVATYANFLFLFLVFISTDYLRYKPLIVIESLGYLATRIILVWGDGIPIMQFMQVTYGLASAAEIAYYSYIYAIVDKEHYQKVSSYTRAATLFGRGVSGIIGQVLISTHTTNYLVLNYISFGSVTIAVIVSFFLPKVNKNVFSLDAADCEGRCTSDEPSRTCTCKCWSSWMMGMKRMFLSFKRSYKNKQLLMWSIWWAFAMCGGLQVENYVMNLWSDILAGNTEHVYNGAVFASGTILSGLVVSLFSIMKLKWSLISEVLIGLVSIIETVLLLCLASTSNIWVAYSTYVLFRISYAFIITVASFQIALHVEMSGYALIFGWNTFVALALQSLLTFVVCDKKGFNLDEKYQFFVYGCYFGVIALFFLLRPIFILCKQFKIMCSGRLNAVGHQELSAVTT